MLLNEFDSKKLLEQVGIEIPKGYFIKNDVTYLGNISRALSFIGATKYVIKIVSPDIIHKSDVGGVVLDIPTENVFREVNIMIPRMEMSFPDAKIEGVLLQEMAPTGIECIIGIKEDPQFGKVIIFGLGGIYTEIFNDISMRVLPITRKDAQEMITETKVYKILNGARGKHYDIEAITDSLMKVSYFADSRNIKEIDINPLIVYEKGVKALDARIMI